MFEAIGEDDLIVSQSTISMLELSPCRWYYGRGKKTPPSPQMSYGTSQHALIEEYIEGKITAVELVDPLTALRVVTETLADDGWDFETLQPDQSKRAAMCFELAEAAELWLSDWWQADENQNLEVHSVEEPFAMLLKKSTKTKPAVWFVTGGIDLIKTNFDFIDWKTAGYGWKDAAGSAMGQTLAYAMLIEDKYNVLPKRGTYVVYDRGRKLWTERPTSKGPNITREAVDAYRVRVDGWVKYMLNPFHLCTPSDGKQRGWWAKPTYCDTFDDCPTCRHLGDGYDTKPANDRSTW